MFTASDGIVVTCLGASISFEYERIEKNSSFLWFLIGDR